MKEKLRVLLIFDTPGEVERGYSFAQEFKEDNWWAESEIHRSLKKLGYETRLLGLYDNAKDLIDEVHEFKPDIVFNSAEVFKNRSSLDKNVVSLLQMLGVRYTGASPTTMAICNNKELCKKILSFHKIHVPHFKTFYKRRTHIKRATGLKFPLIVKPLKEEASRGISQASIVDDEGALVERVKFIHQSIGMDAIAEEYIDGRELYVSVLGRKRIRVLPIREMSFGNLADNSHKIATYKAKWDLDYRDKWDIQNDYAKDLSPDLERKIARVCKRAYKILEMRCYARFDLRVSNDGVIYIIEANANPSLSPDDEFAHSAEKAGMNYAAMVKKIVELGLMRPS